MLTARLLGTVPPRLAQLDQNVDTRYGFGDVPERVVATSGEYFEAAVGIDGNRGIAGDHPT